MLITLFRPHVESTELCDQSEERRHGKDQLEKIFRIKTEQNDDGSTNGNDGVPDWKSCNAQTAAILRSLRTTESVVDICSNLKPISHSVFETWKSNGE